MIPAESGTDPATGQVRLAARSRNNTPNEIRNKIAQIKTGHHVPVAPETAKNSVATPRTTVMIVNRFRAMSPRSQSGSLDPWLEYPPLPQRRKGCQRVRVVR